MNAQAQRVDAELVLAETQRADLALIDEAVCALQRDGNDQEANDLLAVSAAVANLIEAAQIALNYLTENGCSRDRLRAALARVGGAQS